MHTSPEFVKSSMFPEPLAVVTIAGGPRDGERFVTRLTGLVEGLTFPYLGGSYTFTRNPKTGRWEATPVRAGCKCGDDDATGSAN